MAPLRTHLPPLPRLFRPPPSAPDPIKGCSHSGGTPHPFTSPPPFLCRACAIIAWSQSSACDVPPPRCHPSSGERSPGRAASPSSRCHPRGKPLLPRAAARPRFGEPLPRPCPRSTMDRRRPWSTSRGPSPRILPLENNSKPIIPCHFVERPLFLLNINPQSTKFQEDPWIFENNSIYTPSHFLEITNRFSKLFSSYLCIHNSDFSHSCTKIIRILHSLIPCNYNTYLLHIY
jgi:hypothetical protein